MLITIFKLPEASTVAGSVDNLYDFIFWLSVVSFIAVVAALLYFMVKYRSRYHKEDQVPQIEGHTPSEVGVSVLLLVLVMIIFAWGWKGYQSIVTSPQNALEISVVGKQWLWDVEYKNGRKLVNELYVPLGQPVKLIMTSNDVLHSFYVPNFRVKQDVVPNRYTYLNFTATELGEHVVFCAEYCGTAHSGMLAKIHVVNQEEYEKWQKVWEYNQTSGKNISNDVEASANTEVEAIDPVKRGEALYQSKACMTCHTTTGQKLIGPSFKGLFGSERKFIDGSTVIADENYIRSSIAEPQLQVVEGYAPVMPTYQGTLSDQEIGDLISYIKSLK